MELSPKTDLTAGVWAYRGDLDPRRVWLAVSHWDEATGIQHGGDLLVRMPTARSLRWVVPEWFGYFPPVTFQVAVVSSFHRNGNTCRPACVDHAPEPGAWLTVP